MSAVDFETLAYLESAADPSSAVFNRILTDLYDVAEAKMASSGDDESSSESWTRKFPFCGSAIENRRLSEEFPDLTIGDRSTYIQGVLSLARLFVRISLIYNNVKTISIGKVLIVSSYARELCDMFAASDPMVTHIEFVSSTNYIDHIKRSNYAVVVFDHTTVTGSVNQLLAVAGDAGVKIVEGLFYFSPAIDQGWSGVYGDDRILISHTEDGINVGPVDDPTRILYYPRQTYKQFTDPSVWGYKARKWFYEIKSYGLLSAYTASFVGDNDCELQTFRVPVCSSSDMVLVTLDKRLADGLFSAAGSQPGVLTGAYSQGVSADRTITTTFAAVSHDDDIFSTKRDYAIEVRKKLFDDAVLYLVGRQKGTDLITEAIKYIAAHNYTDLFEGTRVISAKALSYTDGLCVAVVCALQAYSLRYGLTNESIRAIMNAKDQGRAVAAFGFSGFLSRLSYVLRKYVKRVLYEVPNDFLSVCSAKLASTDLVPGIFYDVYRDRTYTIGAKWYESGIRSFFQRDLSVVPKDDPITGFMGGNVDASAPDFLIDEEATSHMRVGDFTVEPHPYEPVQQPEKKLQDVYDSAFPGNSVADLANVAELRKTRDMRLTLDFQGAIKIGMDTTRPEEIHDPLPLRTSALPPGRAGLLDSVLATAKRNFSVPDMHDVNDVWRLASNLVDEFITHACVPGAKQVCESYQRQPIHINVNSYNDWLMGKSESYYKALMGDIPEELVELGLEKYTSILKSRVKPKLSVTAQQQLGQPQVVNHQRKVETAVFSGEFRKGFQRFDSLLKDTFFSAGRVSDKQISEWLTKHKEMVQSSVVLEADSTMYDKSQSLLALMIEVVFLQRLGMSADITEALKQSFVGTVSSRNAGLSFIIAMQRKSGHVDTMIGNLIFNFITLARCVGYDKIRGMIGKGDDNVAFLKPQTFEGKHAAVTAEKMGKYFNLESKMILDEVPGFSSGGIVMHNEAVRFFPDPLKLIELLGEKVRDGGLLDRERYESYRDRVSAYNYQGLPELIQEWVRKRYRIHSDIVGAVEALLTIASSFEIYKSIH